MSGWNKSAFQLKQTMTGSLIKYDENWEITNSELLNIIIPQKRWKDKHNFIDLRLHNRILFDLEECEHLCKEYKNEKRNSLINSVSFLTIFNSV